MSRRRSALASTGQMSRTSAVNLFEGLAICFTGNGLCDCPATRPIIQEVRLNSCAKLTPVREDIASCPVLRKPIAHQASLCPAFISSLRSTRGPRTSLGLFLLCLLTPMLSSGERTPCVAVLASLTLKNVFLITLQSLRPSNMLRFTHIQDDVCLFLLQLHSISLLLKFPE